MNSLFGDWKWKNPFATIQKPNPQDFVIREGVSVNPHRGLDFYEREDLDGNLLGVYPYHPKETIVSDSPDNPPGWDSPKPPLSDAPTYQKIDEEGYKEVQKEYAKQQEILAAQRQQFAELAAGSGTPQPTGAGSVNVGSRGPIQINPLNPVAQIKKTDILTGPFLGRWRR